jgi:hypothetical protein
MATRDHTVDGAEITPAPRTLTFFGKGPFGKGPLVRHWPGTCRLTPTAPPFTPAPRLQQHVGISMTTADNMRGLAWRSVFSGWLFGPRRQVGVTGFILGYSLATLVLFHGPFFARAVSFLEAFDAFGWLTLASVLVILIFLKVVALC